MPAVFPIFIRPPPPASISKNFRKNTKISLDKRLLGVYNKKADFGIVEVMTNGGVTQLVEYPVHTRSVTCSSQVAATRPVGQAVKTPPFHGGNMGSIPVRVTRKKHLRKQVLFSMISVPVGTEDIADAMISALQMICASRMIGTDMISCLRSKYIMRQSRISYRASDIS